MDEITKKRRTGPASAGGSLWVNTGGGVGRKKKNDGAKESKNTEMEGEKRTGRARKGRTSKYGQRRAH